MSVLTAAGPAIHLQDSIGAVRGVMPLAGCGFPAAALHRDGVAAWTRARGWAVTACGSEELDLVQRSGIRPVHVVLRCGPAGETIRRAAGLGVVRFIVSTPQQVATLADCAHRTKYVYLDTDAPAVLGERRLDVIGLHSDIDASGGSVEWGSAAERLLCRMAHLRTCGLRMSRISLAGGSTDTWLAGSTDELTAIAAAVDDALNDGCARWRLPRPAVVLGPLL